MVDETKPEGDRDPNRDLSRSGPQHPLHPRRPFTRRQLLMQFMVAGVILVSGIGIGAGGTILALRDRIIPRVRLMSVDPRPGPEPNDIVARWKRDYGLSDKQALQVKDIITKQFTDLRNLRQTLFQAEQGEREKSATSIKKVLTSEQYAKWDQEMKERAQQFERMRASRGPRGDHKGPPHGDRGPGPRMGPDGRRGDWPPRPPMGPDDHHKGDRPPDQPVEFSTRPADGNTPK